MGCGFVRIRNPDGDTVDGGGIAVVEGVDEDPDIPAVIPAMNAETIIRRIIPRIIPPQPMAIHSPADFLTGGLVGSLLTCGMYDGYAGCCTEGCGVGGGCTSGEVVGSFAPHFGQNGILPSMIGLPQLSQNFAIIIPFSDS